MLPNSILARRAASSDDTPERTRSAAYSSIWNRSSSVMPCSKRRRNLSTRTSDRRRFSTSYLLRGCVQRRADRRDQPIPAFRFLAQPAVPRGGQRVVFGAPVVVADTPLG